MPQLVQALTGDSLGAIAARYLGDSSRFREIADLNDLSPLALLQGGTELEIPTPDEVLNQIRPALTSVRSGLTSALAEVEGVGDRVRGYTQEARRLVGEVNGVLGDVESELDSVLQAVRQYQGEAVRLVDWLLAGEAGSRIQGLISDAISSIDLPDIDLPL